MNLKPRLLQTFLDTIKINEIFRQEKDIIDYVIKYSQNYGAQCEQDNFGNVICRYSGHGESILLNTHLDIPEPAENIEYTIEGDIVRSKGKTILGADPKSGLALLLGLMWYIEENNIKTSPIEFVFTLGEEADLISALNLDYSKLKSKTGMVIGEDGHPTNLVTGVVGMYNVSVVVKGKIAYSRDWKDGINAIEHVAYIISLLKQGKIIQGVTFNIGVLNVGTAVNSVAGQATFEAELRSFDMKLMEKAVQNIERTIMPYAEDQNLAVVFNKRNIFSSYKLKKDHELFKRLEYTYRKRDMHPNF